MIEVSHLSKRYGALTAVDDLSFSVGPGEILGFLGPNGAGKSTTMRVLAGYLAPTSGTVTVCGHDVERDPVGARRVMGYLPEGAPAWSEMTVRGMLGFIADVRRLSPPLRAARLDHVIGRLGLEGVLGQTIGTLSKGFRRRVGLAQAILHDPAVLILDEPTDGLDPNQKHEVRGLINEMSRDKIIIVSTHILEEVAAVCSRAIIIAHGRLLADDTPAGLESRSRYHNAVSLRFMDAAQAMEARTAIAALPGVREVEWIERENRLNVLPTTGAAPLAAMQAMADGRGWSLAELHLESGRLDEVFREITAGAGHA